MLKQLLLLLFLVSDPYAQGGGDGFFYEPTREPQAESRVQDQENPVKTLDSLFLKKEFQAALQDPQRFYRNGRHKELIQILTDWGEVEFVTASRDSLTYMLLQSQRRRNHIKTIMLHIILFAQQRVSVNSNACENISRAGEITMEKIFEPGLALAISRLGAASNCKESITQAGELVFYLEHDLEIDKLLRINLSAKPDSLLPPIAEKLINILPLYPKTSLKKKTMKTIGDIYYRTRNYPEMRTWYKKVLQIDPNMKKTSTIGYRMKISGQFKLRKILTASIYIIYTLFICLFIFRITKNCKDFRWQVFLKRFAVFLVIYGVAVTAVFLFDNMRYPEAGLALPESYFSAKKPVVPLSALDETMASSPVLIISLGFIPLLFSLIYTSFRGRFSRTIFTIMLILLIAAGWTHFLLLTEFDEHLEYDTYFTKERIFLDGEIEMILQDYPEKAHKANPEHFNNLKP